MTRFFSLISFFFLSFFAFAQTEPVITSWILNTDAETGYANISSNVQSVDYTSTDVYISCTCIPGYDIGPWVGNPNTPSNQNFVFKITQTPEENNGAPVATPLGHIGVWTNGVSIFNAKDAFSYNNQNVWFQNAIVVEGPSFDICGGHPAPNGEYHHHLNPSCLYDVSDDDMHSPIIGYAFDGFPIYGAHAYSNTDGSGGIRRMESSYQVRNMSERTTLPDGSVANFPGPAVSNTYPLGYYIEDYEYVDGLGDLDEHNGRYCITPEYPQGTYAYFCTVDEDFNAVYPYVLGPDYYGNVQSGNTGPQSGHNTIPGNAESWSPVNIETFNNTRFNIYPNPGNGEFKMEAGDTTGYIEEIKLFNATGLMVYAEQVNSPNAVLSLQHLAPGIYFIQCDFAQGCVMEKLIIER